MNETSVSAGGRTIISRLYGLRDITTHASYSRRAPFFHVEGPQGQGIFAVVPVYVTQLTDDDDDDDDDGDVEQS